MLAVETIEPETLERLPNFARRLEWFVENRPELRRSVACMETPGMHGRRLLAILDPDRLRRLLHVALDKASFSARTASGRSRSSTSIRPTSPTSAERSCASITSRRESRSAIFGGNSNWRGPVWFPFNFLIVEALGELANYYGDGTTFEFPSGSGQHASLDEIATALSRRLFGLFLRGADGLRPADGPNATLQTDPHFRDHLLFNEYFHGDDGRGLGASHQTGWTGSSRRW